jgi:hypothetical protein
MKKTILPINELRKYLARVKCLNLLHFHNINDKKLNELGNLEKIKLESSKEIEFLEDVRLVSYKDSKDHIVEWNALGAVNMIFKEQMVYWKEYGISEKMYLLIQSFREGLRRDVEILSIEDSILNHRIILDGAHMAMALYYLYLNEREIFKSFFRSLHNIYVINFVSPAGSLLFPYDFLNICRDFPESNN